MIKSGKTQNIAVVGAGIMGIMSAYMLTRALPDAKVTLYDPAGFPARNASYIAGGMLTPLCELDHMPKAYLGAGLSSIELWAEMSEALGHSFEFTQNGSLLISHDTDRHILERFKSMLQGVSGWRTINAHDIQKIEPYLGFTRGLLTEKEAHLHPQKAMTALLGQIDHKAPKYFDIKENNEDFVIDCRGLGARSDTQTLRGVKGETLVVYNPEFKLSRPVRLMHPRYPLYIVPRAGHEFLIGATIIESDDNDLVSLRSGLELMSALYSLHPSFGDAQILEMNAKARPALPDNMPHIDIEGKVIHCNGLFRHGFLLAPIMAQCVCDVIMGKTNEHMSLFTKETKDAHYFERHIA